jgi:hypothetical protein
MQGADLTQYRLRLGAARAGTKERADRSKERFREAMLGNDQVINFFITRD